MITMLAASTAEQAQSVGLTIGTVIAAGVALWKLKPTRTLILRLFRTTTNHAKDWIDRRIYEGCKSATRDLRDRMYQDGMSIWERTYRLEWKVEEVMSRLEELREDLGQRVD